MTTQSGEAPDHRERVEPDSPWSGVSRGTCPWCGSRAVTHHVLGMVMPDDIAAAPPWVRFAGCVGPIVDRSCAACGLQWNVRSGKHGRISAVADLFSVLAVGSELDLVMLLDDLVGEPVFVGDGDGTLVVMRGGELRELPRPTTLRRFFRVVRELADDSGEAGTGHGTS
jgi:hypothetical protein